MNLKRITHIVFPYALIVVIVLAMLGTAFWSQPLEWLEQALAVDRYWLSLSVFGLLMALATVFAPLTVAIAVPFMAKIFGPFAIFVVSWISWMVGSIVVFWICRRYGKPLAERFFSLDRLESVQQRMPKHLDFWVLLLLRTFIPVDVLSYAVGLFSAISFKKYLLATGIGIVPFAFILSYGPDALSGSHPWLLFSFFLLLFTIAAAVGIFYFSELLRPKVKIYTHSGSFHTDDVFSVAVIQMVLDQQQRRYRVIRTRDSELITQAQQDSCYNPDVFVLDVGEVYNSECNQFDHHQKGGAGVRDNGIQYSTLGLVWEKYGRRLAHNSQEIAHKVDEKFIQAIDGPDNGQELYETNEFDIQPITLYEIIERYYRQHNNTDPVGVDADFARAVEWAKQLLSRVIDSASDQVEKEKQAGRLYAAATNKQLLVTEDHIGRHHFVKFPDTRLIVSPRVSGVIDGDWSVATIPTQEGGLDSRIAFPRSWWGLHDRELEEVSGVKGAKFCHRSGNFICVSNSQKSATQMAEQTLEQTENN